MDESQIRMRKLINQNKTPTMKTTLKEKLKAFAEALVIVSFLISLQVLVFISFYPTIKYYL